MNSRRPLPRINSQRKTAPRTEIVQRQRNWATAPRAIIQTRPTRRRLDHRVAVHEPRPCQRHRQPPPPKSELPRHRAWSRPVAPAQSPLRWRGLRHPLQALVGGLGRGSTITCCPGGFAWKVTPDRDGSFRPLIEMCSRFCRCVKVCRRNGPDEPHASERSADGRKGLGWN